MSVLSLLNWLQSVIVVVSHEHKALSVVLTAQIQSEHVIERHVMTIAAKNNHQVIVKDATVTVSWVGTDSTDSHLSFLT